MKTVIWMPLVALLILSAPRNAPAQHRSFMTRDAGPYLRAGAGVSLIEEGHVSKFTPGPSGGDIDFDAGFNFNVAFGYQFNQYFGLEMEFGGSGNEINSVKGLSVHDTFFYNAPFLANVMLQYPIPRTIITPYIGAGAGGSITAFDTDGFSNGTVTLVGSDSDFVFAWQLFAGVRFDFNQYMSLGAGYKFFSTGDSSYTYPPFSFSGPNAHLDIDGIHSHMIMCIFNVKF